MCYCAASCLYYTCILHAAHNMRPGTGVFHQNRIERFALCERFSRPNEPIDLHIGLSVRELLNIWRAANSKQPELMLILRRDACHHPMGWNDNDNDDVDANHDDDDDGDGVGIVDDDVSVSLSIGRRRLSPSKPMISANQIQARTTKTFGGH